MDENEFYKNEKYKNNFMLKNPLGLFSCRPSPTPFSRSFTNNQGRHLHTGMTTLDALQLARNAILTHDEARRIVMVDVNDRRNLDLLPDLVQAGLVTVDEARKALELPALTKDAEGNTMEPEIKKPVIETRPGNADPAMTVSTPAPKKITTPVDGPRRKPVPAVVPAQTPPAVPQVETPKAPLVHPSPRGAQDGHAEDDLKIVPEPLVQPPEVKGEPTKLPGVQPVAPEHHEHDHGEAPFDGAIPTTVEPVGKKAK